MKTFLEICEEICQTQLDRKVELILADLNEANLLLDQLGQAQFPVLLVIPFNVRDTKGMSGLLQSVIPFNAFLLDKAEQSTVDFKNKDVDAKIVSPMRGLARQFIFKLNTYTDGDGKHIIDGSTQGISSILYTPSFSSGDANLHGIQITCDIPIVEGITGCVA